MSFEPQPAHAWQFENSNVDSVAGLSPSFSTTTSGTKIAPTYTGGKYGQCVYLDNSKTISTSTSNSWIIYTIPSPTYSLNNFSIAAWIYPYTINTSFTNSFLVATPAGMPFYSQFQLTTTGSKSAVTIFNAGSSYSLNSLNNLAVGQWNHHCVTFAGIAGTTNVFATYYINGILQSTTTVNQTTYGPLYIDKLIVGSDASGTGASANAAMDDLRLYRQTLTAAQVFALYTKQGAPVPTDDPKLAWQFENSNIESIQGLVPSSQVSPGPAQLMGSAALFTNVPVVGDAVYFPGTTGSYMDLGANSPASVNAKTSNIFVECWVYQTNSGTPYSQGLIASSLYSQMWLLSMSGGTPGVYIQGAGSGNFTSGAIPLITWTHIAFSWALGPTSNTVYFFMNGGAAGSFTSTTPVAGNLGNAVIGNINGNNILNGYIRDIRVVKGGIVPTAAFPLTFYPAAFTYDLPSYVTGTGSTVFTLLGQFIRYPVGKFNKSIYLDNRSATSAGSANCYVSYPITSQRLNSNSCTASIWIKPYYAFPVAGINQSFFYMTDSQTTYQFGINSGVNQSQIFTYISCSSPVLIMNGQNLTSQVWNHYTMVLSNVNQTASNTSVAYYFNGSKVGATSNVARAGISLLTSIVLGAGGGGYAGGWTELDDLRIYDRALTSTEVASVYLSRGDPAGPKTYATGTSSNVTVDSDGYTTHTFTTPGTFTCLRPGVADVLVVAGGGGGGGGNPGPANGGGGGGGGGVQYFPNYNIRTGGIYTVTVGTGGSGGSVTTRGTNGTPSQFMEIVSFGGGGGGIYNASGLAGGSGGGGGRNTGPSGPATGIYGQGNSGVIGTGPAGSGGGGAGITGSGTIGGAGIQYPAFGTSVYGAGGNAVGATNAGQATGGGGGGNGNGNPFSPYVAGNGGPGIVKIRYLTQGSPQGYETVYTGETTIGTFAGYSQTANVQVFHGSTGSGVGMPYTWVKPSSGTFARIECIGSGSGGSSYQTTLASCFVVVFMPSIGTLVNNDTVTTANMASIGITYAGTITSHVITSTAVTGTGVIINTTGTGLSCSITPKPAGTILYASNAASVEHTGTITGKYGRGHGGGGGGGGYAIIPLAELPPTVAVSVGGGGNGGYGGSGNTGFPSSFGPVPGYGTIVGNGGSAAPLSTSGPGGLGFGAMPSNIFTGGPGTNAQTLVIGAPSYSAFGGGGGGNENVPGSPSLFAGKGGDGATPTSAVQDGVYPGGGGGGGIYYSVGGGKGAAGRVRIIVY